ncbi:MAG: hypothetical protein U1C55_00010 [Smithellaceae bacterium]|nr:hypothetical protein [Smithellaceae bacterium]
MKRKSVVNTLIIGSILLMFYVFAGHDFFKFYFSGKEEIIEAGEHINKICNANGSCPTTMERWQKSDSGNHLLKGNMLYYVDFGQEIKGSSKMGKNQTFKIVYSFFMPDDWFEVQGGVGKKVTSGWTGR